MALRQEAVARVDCLCAARPGGVEDAIDSKVAFCGGSGPDVKSLVGIADVQRFAVRVGIDGHRADSHLAAGAHHAHRDLAAVGYQNLPKHRSSGRFLSSRSYSGIFPCFLGGFVSRLVSSMRRAVMSLGRVSRGWMTASTQPRSAAM